MAQFETALQDRRLSVQTAWDTFMTLLNDMFLNAVRACNASSSMCNVTADPPSRHWGKGLAKGRLPVWKSRQWARAGPARCPGECASRKLRRKLARTYELKRWCEFPDSQRHARESEAYTLCRKLGFHADPWSHETLPWTSAQIPLLTKELRTLESNQRRDALKAWKNFILHEPSGMGTWLRQRELVPVNEVRGLGRSVHHAKEVVALVTKYWEEFWASAQERGPDTEFICATLERNALRDVAGIQWEPPTLQLLERTVRKAKGAAGPDGWAGKELRHLPLEALRLFREQALLWEGLGECPAQLLHTRMVNIPKPHKVQGSTVEIEHVRPISIMSCFWRVWASAWIQAPSLQAWLQANLPKEIAYGKNADALQSAGVFFEHMAKDGYGGSLDFTKCYDLMRPEGTLRLMTAAGFPEGLVGLCRAVWGSQTRWVCWDNCCHSQPLFAGHATAQGCPFGPLSLALWMASGLKATNQLSVGAAAAGHTCVYMDDRSMTARNARALIAKITDWQCWSRTVGLQESQSKTQLTATTAARRRALTAAFSDPERVTDQLEVLGVTAKVSNRAMSAKEEARFAAAKRVIAVLGNLGLPFERFHSAARSFGVAKVAHGWLCNLPNKSDAWSLWTAMRSGQRCLRRANRHIRAILLGGNSHLDIVSAGSLLRTFAGIRGRGMVEWNNRAGSPLRAFRKWMADQGWAEGGPWAWKGCTPELSSNATVPQLLHSLRQGWRAGQWAAFLSRGGRHEVQELSDVSPAQILQFDFAKTRRFSQDNRGYRTVASLATATPCFQNSRDGTPILCPTLLGSAKIGLLSDASPPTLRWGVASVGSPRA